MVTATLLGLAVLARDGASRPGLRRIVKQMMLAWPHPNAGSVDTKPGSNPTLMNKCHENCRFKTRAFRLHGYGDPATIQLDEISVPRRGQDGFWCQLRLLRASRGMRGPLIIARAQYRPWREAASPASSQRAHGLASWRRVCQLGVPPSSPFRNVSRKYQRMR